MNTETTLYCANPSMFRNRPIWFVILVLLSLVIVGIPFLLAWWLECKGTTITVTEQRTTLRKGLLSKTVNEVWHRDVRNVRVEQAFLQRIFGVGQVEISSSGQSGIEIQVAGIPNPDQVREIIDDYRLSAGK